MNRDAGVIADPLRGFDELFKTVAMALCVLLTLSGCGVKRTVKVQVSQKVLQAKTATIDELLGILDTQASKVVSLSSTTLKISFTSGNSDSGNLQEYRSAPGYILLQRPDRIRLNVQNPLTKTTIIELASSGDDFEVWYPRENKFYTGKNSARDLEIEGQTGTPAFGARPIHIYQAILPEALHLAGPGMRVVMDEDQDSVTKYYVLRIFKEAAPPRLIPVRSVWIDRSDLTVARQIFYEEGGQVASRISYLRMTTVQGLPLPLALRIERPLDGYMIDMEFKTWNVNPNLPADGFVLIPPAGAQRITLREKQKSGK
jgi:outer membrane lipoprotein-sorting protein